MTSSQPMSVALDVRLAGREGTGDGAYWLGLVHGLSRSDVGLRFLLLSNAPPPPEIPTSANFHWIQVPGKSSRLWSLVRFPLTARKLGAKAIHTQYNLSPLVGRAGITTIHDVSFFVGPEWFQPRDRFLLQRFVPKSAARAAKVITVSETSRGEIERFIPAARGKVAVTPLARSPLIQPVPREQSLRVAKGLGLEGPFLLTVGTRWPRKNMDLARAAVDLLPKSLPHRLAITGRPGWGEESDSARSVATGYMSSEELSALYGAADLYLAPSRHEGFGLPILEAFACGCPAVCSTGGALPEVAGNAAKVVAGWDPPAWAAAIEQLLGSPSTLDEMRELGRQREAGFTWDKTAEITVRAYQDVIRDSP